jgi:hypothetical protein
MRLSIDPDSIAESGSSANLRSTGGQFLDKKDNETNA